MLTPRFNLRSFPVIGIRPWLVLCVGFSGCLLTGALAYSSADSVGQALDALTDTQSASAKSQARIDALLKDTRALREQARQADAETDQLHAYITELERQVQEQDQQKTALRQQIAVSGGSAPALAPLLKNMVDSLDRFVAGDLPFLQVERRRRIADLRAQLDRLDQPMSGKLRAVIEAYQVEILYGKTLEAYPGQLDFGPTKQAVDFLRVGRVMLFYRTGDGSRVGYWDRDARQWRALDSDESSSIASAMDVVKGDAPPDLLELPMPAAKEKP